MVLGHVQALGGRPQPLRQDPEVDAGRFKPAAFGHQRFRNKYGLQFPLLTDADHQVMDAYGAWGEKTRYGQTSLGVLRSTFLVDEQGRIERAWHNVKADGHAAQVLEGLGPKV